MKEDTFIMIPTLQHSGNGQKTDNQRTWLLKGWREVGRHDYIENTGET